MNSQSWWQEREWTNRRILLLLAVGTFLVSFIWHLPQECEYLGKHTSEIIFALVLALGFTYTLRPLVNATDRFMQHSPSTRKMKRHARRSWATVLVFFGVVAVAWLFGNIGLKPIAQDAQNFWHTFTAQGPEERQQMIEQWGQSINKALAPYRELLPPGAQGNIETAIPRGIEKAQSHLSEWAMHSFSHLGFIVELILVPVLVFYFLADGHSLRSELKLMCPLPWRGRVGRAVDHLDRVLDGYIRGQVIMCLIAWFLVTVGLLILRVPHPFALGLLAGLTRAIPIIGPLLGAVPLALVCLLTTKSLETTGALLIGFTAMHFLESKVLLPKIIGHEVDLHPVSVIIALLLGMEFFGFIGVVLAVPLAALIKVLLVEWHHSHGIAVEVEEENAQTGLPLATAPITPPS